MALYTVTAAALQRTAHATVGSTFTTTFPVARLVPSRSYAFGASSNAYTESTTGRILPSQTSAENISSTSTKYPPSSTNLANPFRSSWLDFT